jgi:hypothetical protein
MTNPVERLHNKQFGKKGRYVVYVGRLPADYFPENAADLPPGLVDAAILFAPTSPGFSQRLCHAFNQYQLAHGLPGRRWAMLALRARNRLRACPAEDKAVSELLRQCPLLSSDRRPAGGEA